MGSSISSFIQFYEKKPEFKVFMFGIDCGGKTTILYRYKLNKTVATCSTVGFNVETFDYKDIKLTCWDSDLDSFLVIDNLEIANAFILVVDSSDRERMNFVKDELKKLISYNGLMESISLLVIANKQDLPNVISIDEINEKLELNKLTRFRKIGIFETIATTGHGLDKCLDWLYNELKIDYLPNNRISETNDRRTNTVQTTNIINTIRQKLYSLFGYSNYTKTRQIV